MSERKTKIIAILIIIAVLVLAGVITHFVSSKAQLSERDAPTSRTLNASEDTPYTDLNGDTFTFDSFRGQVRVVNAWASWCPFCVQELKDFEALAEEYADQDVAVIAVNRKEAKEKAAAFLSTLGEFDQLHFAIDLTDAFYKSIGGLSMPETVFYSANGEIVFHKRGFMTLEEMRTHTEKALNPPTQ